MGTLGKYLGKLGGFAYVRDSRHAARNFGLTDSVFVEKTPRLKSQYFARINFYEAGNEAFLNNFFDQVDRKFITTLLKSVTMPSVKIKTESLNQYNKRRISQTKLELDPVTMVFHDTVDGKTLRLWEMYYEYYFYDGLPKDKLTSGTGSTGTLGALSNIFNGPNQKIKINYKKEFRNDIVTEDFNPKFGYKLNQNRYLIKSIDIFQIHGSRATMATIIHPKISSFAHDTLDYAENSLVQLSITFDYENLVYRNNLSVLSSDELQYFNNGDFLELDKNFLKLPIPVRQRDLIGGNAIASSTSQSIFNQAGNLLSGQSSPQDVARVLLQGSGAITNLQGALDNVIGTATSGLINSSSSVLNNFIKIKP